MRSGCPVVSPVILSVLTFRPSVLPFRTIELLYDVLPIFKAEESTQIAWFHEQPYGIYGDRQVEYFYLLVSTLWKSSIGAKL
jgi:hypothetical protein